MRYVAVALFLVLVGCGGTDDDGAAGAEARRTAMDGDGRVGGENEMGLLPGLDGSPSGVASPLVGRECVDRDVLAGTVTDPGAAWAEMGAAIDAWAPDRNTMPSLPSHPMRIVGWATFTLQSDSLDTAHEYAGHAQLHVDVARRALDC